jgi:CRP-like cAMP-binding protein
LQIASLLKERAQEGRGPVSAHLQCNCVFHLATELNAEHRFLALWENAMTVEGRSVARSFVLSKDHFHPSVRNARDSNAKRMEIDNVVAKEGKERSRSSLIQQGTWIRGIRRIASSLQDRFSTDDREDGATPPVLPSFPAYGAVQHRLSTYLSDYEQRLLMDRASGWRMHQAGTQLAEQDEPTGDPLLVTKGWGCRVHRVHGRGLLVGLILPGDLTSNEGSDGRAETGVWALTTLETIEARPVLALGQRPDLHPGLAQAMQALRAEEVRHLLSHAARLTETCPTKRVAHLVCEIHARLNRVGMAPENAFDMPLSREEFGEALALKTSVAQRALDKLHHDKHLTRRGSRIVISEPARLAQRAGFILH